jgi:hypothetical protein
LNADQANKNNFPLYRKPDESAFRYVFAQPTDKNREITLTVLAFDIPKAVPEGLLNPANN